MKKTLNWNIIFICIALIIVSFAAVKVTGNLSNHEEVDNHQEVDNHGEDPFENAPKDEVTQQIIDLLKNAKEYNGKEISMVAQIFKFNDKILIGRESKGSNGKGALYAVDINPTTINLPEDFNNGDWYKVNGKVGGKEEAHGEHSHFITTIDVISLEPTEAPAE